MIETRKCSKSYTEEDFLAYMPHNAYVSSNVFTKFRSILESRATLAKPIDTRDPWSFSCKINSMSKGESTIVLPDYHANTI